MAVLKWLHKGPGTALVRWIDLSQKRSEYERSKRTEIDLNESEIDLNESEIDLNECEHFPKANLDRSDHDSKGYSHYLI